MMLRVLLLTTLFVVPHFAVAAERPNVIVVLTDDQGFGDVGVNGNDLIHTPHLDRFAEEGTQLTRFYCSPVCAPTRASLMTGRYYYRSGVIHTSRGGAKMAAENVTIAEALHANGYATGIFGKWHLGDNYPMRPQDQGFVESLIHKSGGIGQTPDKPNSYFDSKLWRNGIEVQETGYCTDVFFREAIDFIERRRNEPFFVYLPTNAPHTPLEIADEYVDPYRKLDLDETTSRVYGMVENLDENFGRLVAKLDELKLRDNTLIVFLGDNGPQQARYTAGLKGRKSSVYEGGMRVPCFVQWPGKFAGEKTTDTIAAHIDLFPTILDACAIEPPKNLDGRSLIPLLSGNEATPPDRLLFFQCHRGLKPRRYQNAAVISQLYKLVAHPGTFGNENLEISPVTPHLELYDLAADPGEQTNIAEREPGITQILRREYNSWFDDVRRDRNFTPGTIVIDSRRENPCILSRYQDGNYRDGLPYGWNVKIAQTRQYTIRIDRGNLQGPAELHVDWQNETTVQPLAPDADSADFTLDAAAGVLDVWLQVPGKPRERIADNGTAGNVTLIAKRPPRKKPNVLVIVSDDQRPDTIAALGNPHIKTPHLDALVRRGTAFTRAVCSNPICTPSRAEILSGCSGFENGTLDFGGKIKPELTTWSQAMHAGGYRSYFVGKWHNDGRPVIRGYDDAPGLFSSGGAKWYLPQTDWKGMTVTGYRGWIFQSPDGKEKYPEFGVGLTPDISERFADTAIDVIQHNEDKPFFLHVNFTSPHDPLWFPTGYEDLYDWKQIPLPPNFAPQHPFDHGNFTGRDEVLLPFPRTPEIVKKNLAVYYAVISHMDEQIGRILRTLEETGQADNTIVLFSADHGLAVGSHGLRGKQNMYEHTINVPMVIAGPGVPENRRTAAQVRLRDMYPSICDLTGVPIPESVTGKSFRPVLTGEKQEIHPFVTGYYRDKQRMLRTDRYKIIHYPHIDRYQLFDLQTDPFEQQDLIESPEHTATAASLKQQLRAWQLQVGDPVIAK